MPVESQRKVGTSRLSRPERQLRGQIAIQTRFHRDAEPARLAFAELKATRELREAAGRLVAVRQSQGFADRVEDSATLARIATLIADPSTNSLTRAVTPGEAVASGREQEGRKRHDRATAAA